MLTWRNQTIDMRFFLKDKSISKKTFRVVDQSSITGPLDDSYYTVSFNNVLSTTLNSNFLSRENFHVTAGVGFLFDE